MKNTYTIPEASREAVQKLIARNQRKAERGWTYLYKIVDTLGNVLIWYASHAIEGAKKIKATIKSHSERDGVKQTVITRCSVVA